MDLKEITERINRLSEELEKLRPLKTEDEQRVMQKFRLDWNYNSNNIEGNSLTYGETKALLLFGITAQGKPLNDHLEIEGHNEAIDSIVNVAKTKEPLTEAFIRNLHKLILHESYEIDAITADGQPTRKRVEIGKYKTTPNHVKTITGEIFYFTSPEDTPAEMEKLIKWYTDNLNNKKNHPLMFAVEFHHKFIGIHPFDDGNGRIVRLLMNLLLMQKGLPPVIIKVKDKEEYYRVLQQADSGNLEPSYNFIGAQLIHSLELMISGAKGEDVEELDDIDKEIALLKKELEEREEIKELKSIETIQKLIPKIKDVFGNKILPSLDTIKELYLHSHIYLEVISGSLTQTFLVMLPLENLDDILKNQIGDLNKITQIRFKYSFQFFKKNTNDPFHHELTFIIELDKFHYRLLFETTNFSSKLYHQSPTIEEIKKLSQQAKKVCFSYIRNKLK
ncbi:MAG: Fic family protein [Chlorobi bacterium]|nr:Fic family protein [Chlorobiota bacterium]MCI0717047.1 Fic family protein [Chlorobiota bacterium]